MTATATRPTTQADTTRLVAGYRAVRAATERLCRTLVTEDYVVQSMPDVSPAKWHLAHTTWFFETFILSGRVAGYQPFDLAFEFLFNSYYVTVGDRHCRQNRGQLSRPTVEQVYQYRRHVDAAMTTLLEGLSPAALEDLRSLMEIGLNHEQQHQELMVTDLKHVFWVNPLRPAFVPKPAGADSHGPAMPMTWIGFDGGLKSIGHEGTGFSFDNEGPRHKVWLEPFQLGSRLVTNGEFKNFMADRGYTRAELWLSAGIATAKAEGWEAPLYWIQQDRQWMNHTAWGLLPVDDAEPVCHVSFFEADAFARWAGARLATEAEWETASQSVAIDGNFVESDRCHPAVSKGGGLSQMLGDVWEWTSSAYLGYPGYRPVPGALGEYNGKFMCNQFVLRGGSCATPRSHIRRTYRNFFPPDARWQFSGIRLARGA
jgi:ergothioneine biosynthesis protein EgtB